MYAEDNWLKCERVLEIFNRPFFSLQTISIANDRRYRFVWHWKKRCSSVVSICTVENSRRSYWKGHDQINFRARIDAFVSGTHSARCQRNMLCSNYGGATRTEKV